MSAQAHPNVLFILCDQLRYDTFSHMNHPDVKTPNIDRLRAGGALFTDAVCTCPVCGPSRAAMLTGLYQHRGDYREGNGEPDESYTFWHGDVKTADEIAGLNGYHVEYHGKWHCGRGHRELYEGDADVFGHDLRAYREYLEARYERPEGPQYREERYTKWPYRYLPIDELFTEENCKKYGLYRWKQHGFMEVRDQDTLTAFTVDKTMRFLDGYADGKPFCVTCSILHPHLPMTPNAHYGTLYDPEKLSLPENMFAQFSQMPNVYKNAPPPVPDVITPDLLRQRLAVYYGLIAEIDDHVGRLLDKLEEKGIADDTVVIFASDHGR